MTSPNCGVGISAFFARSSSLWNKAAHFTVSVLSFLALFSNPQVFALFPNAEAQNADSAQYAVSTNNNDASDSNGKALAVKESPWFRLVQRDGAPVQLQTSITRYAGGYVGTDGSTRQVSVDLVGAIHFAEQGYYEALNKEFENYETVVFELVTARGADVKQLFEEEQTSVDTITSPLDFITLTQNVMGNSLGLARQVDNIDYTVDNFVRGDMDSEDFVALLFTNGDVNNFFADSFFAGFVNETLGRFEGWGIALFSANDRRLALRRLFAVELYKSMVAEIAKETQKLESGSKDVDVDDSDAVQKIAIEDRENVIIHLRNKKALEAVKKELDAGRTNVAIFYGVAHLPDLERLLQKELGLSQSGEARWFTAWEMSAE